MCKPCGKGSDILRAESRLLYLGHLGETHNSIIIGKMNLGVYRNAPKSELRGG